MRTLLELIAGVALVVWGTDLIKIAAIRLLGVRLQQTLERISSYRAKSMMAGAGAAIVLQSSNAASLIFCSFLARGAISVESSLFALLGANIGTAIVARILTFDVGVLASVLVVVGVALHLKNKGFEAGHFGRILLGLGLIIIGLHSISVKAEEMFHAPAFLGLMRFLPQDLPFFALIGAVLTLLCYSSLATVVVAAELVRQGSVEPALGMAIVVGANVGTGLSAALAARAFGQRASWLSLANLGFRLLAACLALLGLDALTALLTGRLSIDASEALISGHIGFNLLVLALALPLSRPVCRYIEASGTARGEGDSVTSKYLSPTAVSESQAMSDATREVLRISNRLQTMIENSQNVIRHSDRKLADETTKIDIEIDLIHTAVRRYLNRMTLDRLNPLQLTRWHRIMLSTIHLEHAGDILERNLRRLSTRIRNHGLVFSSRQVDVLVDLLDRLSVLLKLRTSSLVSFHSEVSEELSRLHAQFNSSVMNSMDEYIRSAAGAGVEPLSGADSVYFDLVSDLQHMARLLMGRTGDPVLTESIAFVPA